MKERLIKLFDTIAKSGLKINLKKCIFGVQELLFPGLKLTNKGIITDSSKVDAVTKTKVPTNVTEIRNFLGLVNYCSQFMPGYAELTEPLRKLTKKNTKFKWSNKHQDSFEKLKLALANSETMAYYIPNTETKVIVDVSPIGLGAISSQKKRTGEFRPAVYASKALNPTERRYSKTERESLAVLWALQKFHYFIYDREFTVITGHQPLTKLLSNRGNPTPRIQRWLLQFQPYNYIIKYEPGYMNASDVLSKNSLPNDTNTVSKDIEHFINNIISDALPLSVSLDEIKSETLSDPDLCSIIQSVNTNFWDKEILPPFCRVRNASL